MESVTPLADEKFVQALCADLDTPRAIQILRSIAKNPQLNREEKAARFLFADQVLGLDLQREESPQELSTELNTMLEQRWAARSQKNWEESDRLRAVLEEKGLIIMDSPSGQEWQWR